MKVIDVHIAEFYQVRTSSRQMGEIVDANRSDARSMDDEVAEKVKTHKSEIDEVAKAMDVVARKEDGGRDGFD